MKKKLRDLVPPWSEPSTQLSGLGFGLVICAISALREMAVQGTLWGVSMGWDTTLSTTSAPFAAYLLLGFMAALLQFTRQRIAAFFHRKEEDEE